MIINPYLVAPSAVAPSNTVAPVISGTQVVGSVLSSTTGTWAGTAPITYTYQWYRGASLISGATSNTYTLVQADAGNTSNITCKVTGTNIAGNSTATSNTLAQIFDLDANTFISSASITDSTQKGAINTLCINLKGYSIWTKMKAIYPVVGGSAGSHAVNLKTPGTYNLTFSTGWTHASTGMTPNGTSAYANTNFTASGNLTLYNSHLSYYSRTSGNPAATQSFMGNNSNTGTFDNKAVWNIAYQNTGAALATQHSVASVSDYASATGQTSRAAFWMNNRTSSTSTTLKIWKNGTSVANATTTPGGEVLNTSSAYLGARRNTVLAGSQAELYTNAECAFASIGDGLTDAEAANFYTAVQAYQTTLSRNV